MADRQWNTECKKDKEGVRHHEMMIHVDGYGHQIPLCKNCGTCIVSTVELSPYQEATAR